MSYRTTLITLVVILALLTSGVGNGHALPLSDSSNTSHQLENADVHPKIINKNNRSQGNHLIHPPRNASEMSIQNESAPTNFSNTQNVSQAASTDSIQMDPSDDATDHPLVGETKLFLAFNFDKGFLYFKEFVLLSVSDNMEVWVARNLSWPSGDPRSDVVVTEAQAESMARQFDENIYPVETDTFGTPTARDGSDSPLEGALVPDDYFVTGNGSNRTVLLVDNIRDRNFYDHEFPLVVGGLFSPGVERYTDRNAITLDPVNWKPVNETHSRVGTEGVLAHEYQHLIHEDLDSDELSWVNEGMSMYAEEITGYGFSQPHLRFYEELPSNSLVNWGDQGFLNIIADYGVAGVWTMYLDDQYGREFISTLAKDDANGITGVRNTLNETGADRDFYHLYQDFSTAVVTDTYGQARKEQYTFSNLDVEVNTSNGVETAGVWGPNYREVNTTEEGPIAGVTVSGEDFVDTEWSTATDPVTDEGNVLYSGSGNLLDRHAIVEVNLSATEDPTLTFDSFQRIEENWDYGFVQVSTDGGDTWVSLSNKHTDDTPNESAHPRVKRNLPGFTGDTDGWQHQAFDLSAFEGNESVLVSFRYVTDWALIKDGWYIKDVSIAGESIPTDSTAPYMSLQEARENYFQYQFTFIGIKANENYRVHQLDMRTFNESDQQDLEQFLRNGNFDRVVAISTWVPDSRESGRLPVGVEFEFVKTGDQQGSGEGEGNVTNPAQSSYHYPRDPVLRYQKMIRLR